MPMLGAQKTGRPTHLMSQAFEIMLRSLGRYLATTEPRGWAQSARTYQNWLGLPLGATVVTRCPRSFIAWRASYTLM